MTAQPRIRESIGSLDWQELAACADAPSEWFFGLTFDPIEDDPLINLGRQVCAVCPVRADCLDYALENREPFGLWGGKTTAERRVILRRLGSAERRCDVCDRRYEPKRTTDRYCSKPCAAAAHSMQKERHRGRGGRIVHRRCVECDAPFVVAVSGAGRPRELCDSCREQRDEARYYRRCIVCGETFRTRTLDRVLCASEACHRIAAEVAGRDLPAVGGTAA